MKRSLLIGCGNDRRKKVYLSGNPEWAGELTTMDMNPDCNPDIVIDMAAQYDAVPGRFYLPFQDATFDELGAFDTLEHWGAQGDWKAWFGEMAEYHRIMKPGATFGIIVPIGQDAIADPGHTRFFHQNHFGFLSQAFYKENEGKGTSFTDYRWYWKLDFEILHLQKVEDHHLTVILRKPA